MAVNTTPLAKVATVRQVVRLVVKSAIVGRRPIGYLVFGIEGQGNWADFSGSNRSDLFTEQCPAALSYCCSQEAVVGVDLAINRILAHPLIARAVANNTRGLFHADRDAHAIGKKVRMVRIQDQPHHQDAIADHSLLSELEM